MQPNSTSVRVFLGAVLSHDVAVFATTADSAETPNIERRPRGREEVPVQLSGLLDAHQIIMRQSRILACRASL
jgi:hypothetical protein